MLLVVVEALLVPVRVMVAPAATAPLTVPEMLYVPDSGAWQVPWHVRPPLQAVPFQQA